MGSSSLDVSAPFVLRRGGWESPSELKEVVIEPAQAHGVDMAIPFLQFCLFPLHGWFSMVEGFYNIKLDLCLRLTPPPHRLI